MKFTDPPPYPEGVRTDLLSNAEILAACPEITEQEIGDTLRRVTIARIDEYQRHRDAGSQYPIPKTEDNQNAPTLIPCSECAHLHLHRIDSGDVTYYDKCTRCGCEVGTPRPIEEVPRTGREILRDVKVRGVKVWDVFVPEGEYGFGPAPGEIILRPKELPPHDPPLLRWYHKLLCRLGIHTDKLWEQDGEGRLTHVSCTYCHRRRVAHPHEQ